MSPPRLACVTLLAALLSACGSSEDSSKVYYGAPSWSPDGKSIAFVANDELYVTELGGETIRRGNLVAENEAYDDLTRSPDGTKIAYDICEQSEVNPYCWYSRTVVSHLPPSSPGNRGGTEPSRLREEIECPVSTAF